MRYEKHIFVCTNQREPGHPRGCCRDKGSEQLREEFKRAIKERGLSKKMRVNVSGCLDACEFGPSVVVYPDSVWYGGVRVEDIDEIIESHLLNDIPVERLLIRDPRYLGPRFDDDAEQSDSPDRVEP